MRVPHSCFILGMIFVCSCWQLQLRARSSILWPDPYIRLGPQSGLLTWEYVSSLENALCDVL